MIGNQGVMGAAGEVEHPAAFLLGSRMIGNSNSGEHEDTPPPRCFLIRK